jgi:hypothetical protein
VYLVHGDILARFSEPFKDMFSLPVPADGEGKIEGNPICMPSCVLSREFDHLLAKIYNQ